MQGILTSGFEILELRTQAVETGLYVMALLKANSAKTYALDEKLDFHENFKLSHNHSSPDIVLDEEEDA